MMLFLRTVPAFHVTLQAETIALEYFYSKIASQLSEFFTAHFWTRLVYQAYLLDLKPDDAHILMSSRLGS